MTDKRRLNLCGPHLRIFREEQNLTLSDIQAALDIEYGISLDRTNLGRIESGSRAVSDIELVVLAHLLKISVEQLLWGRNQSLAGIDELLEKVQVSNAERRGSKTKNT